MTINRLLANSKLGPEEIKRLNAAYTYALRSLSVVDRNDPFCEMVARTAVEVGATGTREPHKLAEVAVAFMGIQ